MIRKEGSPQQVKLVEQGEEEGAAPPAGEVSETRGEDRPTPPAGEVSEARGKGRNPPPAGTASLYKTARVTTPMWGQIHPPMSVDAVENV